MATSAHDPLHARALVLESGTTCVAMVVVDTLGAGPEVLDEAKAIASESTGIPAARCSFARHTPTPRPLIPVQDRPRRVAYRKVCVTGISDSIIRAHGALQPAALGASSHPLPEEVFNRRWYLKEGKMPPNPFGKMDAVEMNPGTGPGNPATIRAAAHPATLMSSPFRIPNANLWPCSRSLRPASRGRIPEGPNISGLLGNSRVFFPSRVNGGPEFVAMMSNGASGNINNIPFNAVRPPREPFEQIGVVAQKAADAALAGAA
jgi:hypothetical protein